jgi:hypothetical protein
MDPTFHAQIESYTSHLTELIRQGCEIRDALATNPSDPSAVSANRIWQQQCGILINQLSGGSKAHWLARAFSEAFLLRSTDGEVVETVAPDVIVRRLLDVLQQAVKSLSGETEAAIVAASSEPVVAPRFAFVHNRELRPVVQQAYTESRQLMEQANYEEALRSYSSILEAIVTDALQQAARERLATLGVPSEPIAEWPFKTRLEIAQKVGLIRAGWLRLPPAALGYRDRQGQEEVATVSESDARRTQQVLNVIMRDLNPGR